MNIFVRIKNFIKLFPIFGLIGTLQINNLIEDQLSKFGADVIEYSAVVVDEHRFPIALLPAPREESER